MIEEETSHTLDLRALRIAIEGSDPDLLLGFYSDDAELRIVNTGTPFRLAALTARVGTDLQGCQAIRESKSSQSRHERKRT